MTARLSPAQQRVVDAMRAGAVLVFTREPSHDREPYWTLRPSGSPFLRRVAREDAEGLRHLGVVLADKSLPRVDTYRLTSAYQGGEA